MWDIPNSKEKSPLFFYMGEDVRTDRLPAYFSDPAGPKNMYNLWRQTEIVCVLQSFIVKGCATTIWLYYCEASLPHEGCFLGVDNTGH